MSKEIAFAYGIFRIPLHGQEELLKFREKWREFLDSFEVTREPDESTMIHTAVVKSMWDGKDVKLIDAVLDVIYELEVAVEAESQFVEAILEDDDW